MIDQSHYHARLHMQAHTNICAGYNGITYKYVPTMEQNWLEFKLGASVVLFYFLTSYFNYF